jgi:GNAT superfamily N-acetyltransferase
VSKGEEGVEDIAVASLAHHLDLVGVIAQWHWKEWGDTEVDGSEAEWCELLRSRATDTGIPFTLVGFVGAVPVGSVTVCRDDADPDFADKGPWLSGMLVRPPARNLGVGRHLLAAIERHSRHNGATELWLHTGEAQRFYERCGWTTVRPKTGLARDAVMCRTL